MRKILKIIKDKIVQTFVGFIQLKNCFQTSIYVQYKTLELYNIIRGPKA